MPKNTKDETDNGCEKAKDDAEPSEKTSRSKDQKENPYYYDDAHGYEVYNSEEDEDEEDLD